MRRSRLRTGGHSWRLYHSVAQLDMFLERFTVASWTEFERQRTERWVEYDSEGVRNVIGYTVDRTRQHDYTSLCVCPDELRRYAARGVGQLIRWWVPGHGTVSVCKPNRGPANHAWSTDSVSV